MHKKHVTKNDILYYLTSIQHKSNSDNHVIVDGTFDIPYTIEEIFIVDDNLNNESEKNKSLQKQIRNLTEKNCENIDTYSNDEDCLRN